MRVLRVSGGAGPAAGKTLRPLRVAADLPGPCRVEGYVTRQRVNALKHIADRAVAERRALSRLPAGPAAGGGPSPRRIDGSVDGPLVPQYWPQSRRRNLTWEEEGPTTTALSCTRRFFKQGSCGRGAFHSPLAP